MKLAVSESLGDLDGGGGCCEEWVRGGEMGGDG